ncbi:MAG: ABC transporter ATP-binding protein [Candidatus Eisenbacteria bacterium]|uniref:ABC transporter ATP-binding protein n=1 Tax=Eiseniibacteriota bacterium TaxID=2212470 RepID=A0A538T5I4_UNCEI|nr:MAG: ABC transporter ATP-binding protein [Candidatus Eisenbacteria bacterium]
MHRSSGLEANEAQGESMHATTRPAEVWPGAGSKAAGPVPMDESLAICIRGLARYYKSPWTLRVTRGLEELDLDVERGKVLGLLGPNGAGKTTTLKLLTGLLKPSRGNAWLLGVPIEEPRSRRSLGFLPEQPYFYDYLTGLEYLELAGGLSGLPDIEANERARHWLSRVGLGDCPRLRLRKYSKGMLQRLGLAAALVHDPEILILDEPMSGLDPFGRRDVRELILEQRLRGVTVLFSSHILPDVESVADRVAILHRGRLVRSVEPRDLRASASRRAVVRCHGAPVLEIPRAWHGRLTRRPGGSDSEFEVGGGLELNSVLEWLLRSGAHVQSVTPQGSGLEEIFLSAIGDESHPPGGDTPRGEGETLRPPSGGSRPERAPAQDDGGAARSEPAARGPAPSSPPDQGRRVA